MNATELLKKIRTIDIQTKGWVDSIFSGAYHSRFKGQGVHFNEVRQYAVGDDVRRIDWTVTAKLNEPYIKEFEEVSTNKSGDNHTNMKRINNMLAYIHKKVGTQESES